MHRTPQVLRIALAVCLAGSTGCTLYQPRPVTFTVLDAETKEPIEGATVQATHIAFMDFGLPFASIGPSRGETNRRGSLSLFIDPDTRCLLSVKHANYQGVQYGTNRYRLTRLARRWYDWRDAFEFNLYRGTTGQAEFVLPERYRGPVVIYFAPTDVPPSEVGQRSFTYAVSDRGAAFVPQSGLLGTTADYANLRARYPNAAPLPTYMAGDKVAGLDVESVAFRFVAADWASHAWIFHVGTMAEAVELYRRVFSHGNHEDEKAIAQVLAAHPRPAAVTPAASPGPGR